LLRTELTIDELNQEVEKAMNFRPRLATFIIATTGPRDSSVQERARVLTEEHKAKVCFLLRCGHGEKFGTSFIVAKSC
jgi:hypothetical protein